MRGICGRPPRRDVHADGFYRTGDLGALDADGYLWYHGRLDDMFKVKGATVYPAEVEAALRVARRGAPGARHRRGRRRRPTGARSARVVVTDAAARRPRRRRARPAERVQGADPLGADRRPGRRADDRHRQGRQARAAAAASNPRRARASDPSHRLPRERRHGRPEAAGLDGPGQGGLLQGRRLVLQEPRAARAARRHGRQRRRAGDPHHQRRRRGPRPALRRGRARPVRARRSAASTCCGR